MVDLTAAGSRQEEAHTIESGRPAGGARNLRQRLTDSVETALKHAEAGPDVAEKGRRRLYSEHVRLRRMRIFAAGAAPGLLFNSPSAPARPAAGSACTRVRPDKTSRAGWPITGRQPTSGADRVLRKKT